jgi:beta-galactosidase
VTCLAEAVRALDPSRPVSNGICSFWNGLDDALMGDQLRMWRGEGGLQNADMAGDADTQWERYTEGFANGLDVVGYNYLEDKYEQDHALYPERVMLGSENYPVEVGRHWPMIQRTPWVIGEFTWTAWDYIGEAGIGRSSFYAPGDPDAKDGACPWIIGSPFPWRLANDADFDITGAVRPQGVYRHIVWGSDETAVFSYDPRNFGKTEVLTGWGFPGVWDSWTWRGQEGKSVDVLVFSGAEEVELWVNGTCVGRKRASEAQAHDMPMTFRFQTAYVPGTLEAVSYRAGREVSRAALKTAGAAEQIRLVPETGAMRPDGESLAYVGVELVDGDGLIVPDAAVKLMAEVNGVARLLGFGSGNPVTDENYTRGEFTSYRGRALAVLRSGYTAGTAALRVTAGGLGSAEIELPVGG